MKKFIPILFICFVAFTLKAQITITGADMPRTGIVNVVTVDTMPSVDIGTPDTAAQVWDFTGVTYHYTKVASYTAVTPYQHYATNFPGANLYTYGPAWMYAGLFGGAPVDLNQWGYMYWTSDSSGFKIVGFRTNYGLGDYNILESPQEVLMFTPASYDSVYYNNSKWSLAFDKVPSDPDTIFNSTVIKTLTCDAFGSMITPFGTFDVIRVHEYILTIDSAIVTIGGLPFFAMEFFRDTVNNYTFWTNNLGYPVALAHANADNNLVYVEYLSDTLAGGTISGTVYKSDGVTPVSDGIAELIARSLWDGLFGIPEIIELTPNGQFQFAQVVTGANWLVHAEPDPVLFPYSLPTYYGDSVYWEDAATLNVISDTNVVINTKTDSLGYQFIGNGIINGNIWQNLTGNKTMEDAANVKVTLILSSGETFRHTYTDENGQYSFNNLPADDFTVQVDVPGVYMDSTYSVMYSTGDTTSDGLDFYYDSLFVYIYYTISVEEFDNSQGISLNAYPNPFTEKAVFSVEGTETGQLCELNIFDISGRLLTSLKTTTQKNLVLYRENINSGLLIYEFKVDGRKIVNGKIIAF